MSPSGKRLLKDLKAVQSSVPDDKEKRKWDVFIDEKNISEWKGYIYGKDNGIYSGGRFEFSITFPPEYPFKAPRFRFENVDALHHPGVNKEGAICLATLSQWTPPNNPLQVLNDVWDIINDPELKVSLESPLRPEIAEEFRLSPDLFRENAQISIIDNMPLREYAMVSKVDT